MGWIGRDAVALMMLVVAAVPAAAAERIALLIGNQSYTSEIGKLANPHNDIALLEKALKGLQFDVTSMRDAGLGTMHQAVNAYVRRLKVAGPNAIGFFYYAGHGAADAGTNYLIPVDVKSPEEGDLWDVSLRLTEVTGKLKKEAGNATHFVVFDACRNELKLRKAGSKSLVQARGFVPVPHESGMLIAYATAEGETASDVGAGAGPYSSALADEIIKPGIEAVTMFRNVQRRVRLAIKQEPYLGFNALGDVYLAGQAPDPSKMAASIPPLSNQQAWTSEAAEAWNVAKDTQSVATLEAFIRRFGDTFYGDLAKDRLADLKQIAAAKETETEKQRSALLKRELDQSKVPRPGTVFRDCPGCPEMVVVPAGEFIMGSKDRERFTNEGPPRKVSIAKSFAVGKFEVTFDEWDACVSAGGCKSTPKDEGWGRGRRPVINVDWRTIGTEYLPWLSRKTGKAYRLLTEAEWEYAARAGTTTEYSTGETITPAQANFRIVGFTGETVKGASRDKTLPVGSFPGNGFGLFDVHGNVRELVADCYVDTYTSAPNDGSPFRRGSENCSMVSRGGSWLDADHMEIRSSARSLQSTRDAYSYIGFRLARDLD